jgi:hypothetical protein
MKTNIITASAQLLEQFQTELDSIRCEQIDNLQRWAKSQQAVRLCLQELKTLVCTNAFLDKHEEIRFFKEIKPVFISQHYYFQELAAIKLEEPWPQTDNYPQYLLTKWKHCQQYIRDNYDFYQYCLIGATHRDEIYFTRGNYPLDPQSDDRFTTGYDTLLGKILANQMIKDYLTDQRRQLLSQTQDSQSILSWTESKTALIELMYALHAAQALNNGNMDLKAIAAAFEKVFNVNLGNYYRTFQDIRLRKKSQTHFLDLLIQQLHHRMEAFDE